MRLLSVLSVLVGVACGASDPLDEETKPDAATVAVDATPTADGAITVADASGADSGGAPVVPDPGTGPLPFAWPDREPNDTPEQAVAIGLGSGQIGPYIGLFDAEDGHLGGGDDADHFVFRTEAGKEASFIAGACWDAALAVNLLDFTLYKVIDGQPLVPIQSSRSSDTRCETQEPFSIPLEPDSKYLFVVTHVEGEGDYSA